MIYPDTDVPADPTPPAAEPVADRAIGGSFYDVQMVGAAAPFRVRISNRDYLAYDLTAGRKKWPRADAAPFLARTFVCWSAAKRDGHFDGGFETFQREADQIEEVDDPGDEATAHPSPRTPGVTPS